MPPSRRTFLTAATATAGLAGCVGQFRTVIDATPPIDGPCPDVSLAWPTTGSDPGRTGRTNTAPPPADADAFDPLAAGGVDGPRRLTPALPAIGEGTLYVPTGRGIADDTELLDWLFDYVLPIEASLTADEMATAAKLGYLELIENATTTRSPSPTPTRSVARPARSSSIWTTNASEVAIATTGSARPVRRDEPGRCRRHGG